MTFHWHTQLKVAVFLSVIACSLPLIAGWTSSGGETLKDKINPWFFQNTTQVNYCILVDQQNFGQSIENIRYRIRKSLQIWKHQLQNLQMRSIGGQLISENTLRLGTQIYNEVPCSIKNNKIEPSNIDITFQFGVLTGEQISKLGDPTKYIGITVRTDYDLVTLKAKGFVYFSPESGPLKLNKVGLRDTPWSSRKGRDLLDALIHEIGHIYGIQHTNDLYLMQETYLETLLSASNEYSDDPPDLPYEKEEGDFFLLIDFFKFEVPDRFQFDINCRTTASSEPIDVPKDPESQPPSPPEDPNDSLFAQFKVKPAQSNKILLNKMSSNRKHTQLSNPNPQTVEQKYFGYAHNSNERQVRYCYNILRDGNKYRFEFVKEIERSRQVIGVAESLTRFEKGYKDQRAIVRFWIPKEQRVFPFGNNDIVKEFSERTHDIGLTQLNTVFKGNYKILSTGQSKPFFIQTQNFWRISFGGQIDGNIYLDLDEEF